MTLLTDALQQLDADILDGAIEALHLKHIGSHQEAKELEEEVASGRREHRRLMLVGYYQVTGAVMPDVGDVEIGKRIRARLRNEGE